MKVMKLRVSEVGEMSFVRKRQCLLRVWGALDIIYVLILVAGSVSRGMVPFLSDFNAALENVRRWGGDFEFFVWVGGALQISVLATGILLCCGKKLGIYLALAQIPFRLFFLIPSVSVILLLPTINPWLWAGLLIASELAKAYSLWWYWKGRRAASFA
ncbi:hypothetical protein ACQKO7_11295 [Pseudomonas putida]|uniref:hypothetical protein n=1 Tax=Pseudomonas putida TaxID=303 RepID=UPI003D088E15